MASNFQIPYYGTRTLSINLMTNGIMTLLYRYGLLHLPRTDHLPEQCKKVTCISHEPNQIKLNSYN